MANSNEERVRFANDEILEKGNLAVIDDIFATTYVARIEGKPYKGPKFVRQWVGQLRSAFPRLRVVEIECLIERGNMIAWRRTLGGKHEGALMGIPPRDRKVVWRDMLVSRLPP